MPIAQSFLTFILKIKKISSPRSHKTPRFIENRIVFPLPLSIKCLGWDAPAIGTITPLITLRTQDYSFARARLCNHRHIRLATDNCFDLILVHEAERSCPGIGSRCITGHDSHPTIKCR